jgi:hypothetical protein
VPLYQPLSGVGLLRAAQTCFLFLNDGADGPPSDANFTEETDGSTVGNNWEDGDVMRLDSAGDYVEFEFNLRYRMPTQRIGIAYRWEYNAPAPGIPINVTLNGTSVRNTGLAGDMIPMGWSTDDGDNFPFALDPDDNPHTLRFEIDGSVPSDPDSGETSYMRLDVLSVFDTDYHTLSNFPNQIETDTGASGYSYLPAPSRFPDEVSVQTQDATPPISISGAELSVDIASTYGAKQLELSPDQGSTWPLSATDTETLSGDFASLAAQVRARITLGARGEGQSETPIDGYASPELLTHELFADLDETPLFVSENFQGSVLDVLVNGADYADALFEVQWDVDAGSQSVEWTQPGQREAVAEADIADYQFTRTTEERRDRIRIVGRSVPVTGEEFTADHGTAVALNNSPILSDSETVAVNDTQYTQGQDYTVDWEAGEITTLSSGAITDGVTVSISYRWQPLGTADRAGATAPYTVRKVSLPGLSTDRECAIAARRIRDATAEPLEEAEVTLPPEAIGLEAIDNLQFVGLPSDDHLDVNNIGDDTGQQTVLLGNRRPTEDYIADIRRKLSSTAENS